MEMQSNSFLEIEQDLREQPVVLNRHHSDTRDEYTNLHRDEAKPESVPVGDFDTDEQLPEHSAEPPMLCRNVTPEVWREYSTATQAPEPVQTSVQTEIQQQAPNPNSDSPEPADRAAAQAEAVPIQSFPTPENCLDENVAAVAAAATEATAAGCMPIQRFETPEVWPVYESRYSVEQQPQNLSGSPPSQCLPGQPFMYAAALPVYVMPVVAPLFMQQPLLPPAWDSLQLASQQEPLPTGISSWRQSDSGTFLIYFTVSAAILSSKERSHISPRFELGDATFRMKLKCRGRGFKHCAGKGTVELSCEHSFEGHTKGLVSYRFRIGVGAKEQEPRAWVKEHDFAQNRTSGEEEFNFSEAVDGATFTVVLEISSGNASCPVLQEPSGADDPQTQSTHTGEQSSKTNQYAEATQPCPLNPFSTDAEDTQANELSHKAIEFAQSVESVESVEPAQPLLSSETKEPMKIKISPFLSKDEGHNSSRRPTISSEPEAEPVCSPGNNTVGPVQSAAQGADERSQCPSGDSPAEMHHCSTPLIAPPQAAENKQHSPPPLDAPGDKTDYWYGVQQHWKNVCVRNIPNNMKTTRFLKFLGDKGCTGIDFIYVPHDFKRRASKGFGFVNFTTAEGALKAFEVLRDFGGLKAWKKEDFASTKKIIVGWAKEEMQGRENLISFCRNSTVMHPSVEKQFKPILLKNGVVEPFPEPTKRLRPPQTSEKPK
mmetsp:Transcript_81808/g.144717  ORF Transcript_81808/g.144717 Transcript_81808/m.144717 type:complete len:713 (+) Transcript_81808:56-2194(+)